MYASSGLDLEVPPVAVPLLAAAAAAAETIHLGHETTRVPESLLEPPIENDRRRVTVDLAAFLLDRHLRRVVAMRNPLELRIARLLGRLENSTGPLELGFARLSDYVIERLGISVRRMVDLLKMDRRLVELPRSAEAFASGRITTCQLRALLRVATSETESGWLEKSDPTGVLGVVLARLPRAGCSSRRGLLSWPSWPWSNSCSSRTSAASTADK